MNIEENNFSKQFAPLWKQFKISQNILLLIWGISLLISFFNSNLIITKGLLLSELYFIFLFALTLIWISYFSFKFKCPKCDQPVYPYGNNYYSDRDQSGIYFTGKCCHCGAILKEGKISRETKKKFNKILNIIAIIISIGVIVTLIKMLKC